MPGSTVIQGADGARANVTEAQHSILLYSNLLGFEEGMLGLIRERMSLVSADARLAAERIDLPELEEDCGRFRERLSFWRERLEAAVLASESPHVAPPEPY